MKKRKLKQANILIVLALALIFLYSINLVYTSKIFSPIRAQAAEQKPASLSFFLIKNDCENCFDMGSYIKLIKAQNVRVIQENTLNVNDKTAQNLIKQHAITSLPAMVVTGEVSKASLAQLWSGLGGVQSDSAVVIQGVPPYYDLSARKVVGLVDVIYLADDSCLECYDVNDHQLILQRFGISVDQSLPRDASSEEGKALIKKYSITKLPTILLSPAASAYTGLVQVWPQVGTKGADGWYVFRSVELMGTYKNLSSGKIVNASVS